jgi:ATP-dependent Zn protease
LLPQDGSAHDSVIVFGATNRLDFIDAALLRKGRFHHVLHVPVS